MSQLNVTEYTNQLIKSIVDESKSIQGALIGGTHSDFPSVRYAQGIIFGMDKSIESIKETYKKLLESNFPTQDSEPKHNSDAA